MVRSVKNEQQNRTRQPHTTTCYATKVCEHFGSRMWYDGVGSEVMMLRAEGRHDGLMEDQGSLVYGPRAQNSSSESGSLHACVKPTQGMG